MRSRRLRARDASATARYSSSMSSRQSAFAPARPARTQSEIPRWATSTSIRGRPKTMANSPQSILSMIKAKEVKFVDVRFTDPRGKWQHVTFDLSMVDEDFLTHGTMFDGSSIAGWKAINESDMTLVPDLDTAVIDPFFAAPKLLLICDVVEHTR